MESKNQYDELLVKYLVNEVDEEEKLLIEKWVDESEENQRYFQDLKNAWQLISVRHALDYVLDEMNLDEKWNHFKQRVAINSTSEIPIDDQQQIEYGNEQGQNQKSRVFKLLVSLAIAASIIGVIGLGIFLRINNKPNQQDVAVKNNKRADTGVFSYVHREVNTTEKDKRIQLPDGSLIVLASNSELTYREPFLRSRDISLVGQAHFRVAKDKTSPFTVTSGEISTTALGTEFSVTAFKNTDRIVVRLYGGKVVIKAVRKDDKRMKRDVYLLPGQELFYGGLTAIVRNFKLKGDASHEQLTKEEVTGDNPSIPENTKTSYFMFNNQTLAQVLDNLAALYDVKIIYDKKDLEKVYFTGRYNRSDSLEPILRRIGILNKLTIAKKDNTFIISK
jgi:transmembrane sensor